MTRETYIVAKVLQAAILTIDSLYDEDAPAGKASYAGTVAKQLVGYVSARQADNAACFLRRVADEIKEIKDKVEKT